MSAVIQAKGGHILDSAVPGEEVEVQVSVKCALNPDVGHWSSWSRPVRAAFPQSAGEFKRGGEEGATGNSDRPISRPTTLSCDLYCHIDAVLDCSSFSCLFSDDISLTCVTPDVESIICRWNGSRYGVENEYRVSYQMDLRCFTVS